MGHTSVDTLNQRLNLATNQVPPGSVWAHYKTPTKTYTIVGVGLIEETEQPAVIYQANYATKLIWIRPLDNFLAQIEHNGQKINRFKKLEGENGS